MITKSNLFKSFEIKLSTLKPVKKLLMSLIELSELCNVLDFFIATRKRQAGKIYSQIVKILIKMQFDKQSIKMRQKKKFKQTN